MGPWINYLSKYLLCKLQVRDYYREWGYLKTKTNKKQTKNEQNELLGFINLIFYKRETDTTNYLPELNRLSPFSASPPRSRRQPINQHNQFTLNSFTLTLVGFSMVFFLNKFLLSFHPLQCEGLKSHPQPWNLPYFPHLLSSAYILGYSFTEEKEVMRKQIFHIFFPPHLSFQHKNMQLSSVLCSPCGPYGRTVSSIQG